MKINHQQLLTLDSCTLFLNIILSFCLLPTEPKPAGNSTSRFWCLHFNPPICLINPTQYWPPYFLCCLLQLLRSFVYTVLSYNEEEIWAWGQGRQGIWGKEKCRIRGMSIPSCTVLSTLEPRSPKTSSAMCLPSLLASGNSRFKREV